MKVVYFLGLKIEHMFSFRSYVYILFNFSLETKFDMYSSMAEP